MAIYWLLVTANSAMMAGLTQYSDYYDAAPARTPVVKFGMCTMPICNTLSHHMCRMQRVMNNRCESVKGCTESASLLMTCYSMHFISRLTSSLSSVIMATGVPTGMSLLPSPTRILARNPSSWFSHSSVACGIDTTAYSFNSPSFFQDPKVPSNRLQV